VRGSIGLEAVVSDGQGWSRSLLLAPPRPFHGPATHTRGRLDLRRLASMLDRVRASTGLQTSSFTLALVGRIEVAGAAGISLVDDAFTPAARLTFDDVALRPDTADGDRTSFEQRREGEGRRIVPANVTLGPVSLTVTRARTAAFSGAGAAFAVGVVAALLLGLARGPGGRPIPGRLRGRLVAATATIPEDRWVSDVASLEELTAVAERFDRVVLHVDEGRIDTYLVDDGITVYRFSAPRPGMLPALRQDLAPGR
jgi:hypothetical protein